MNGHLGRLVPPLAGRIMPINNFMLATAPLGEAFSRALIRDDVAVADTKHVIDYFRLSADRRLLFGGGETYTRRLPADLAGFVRPLHAPGVPATRGNTDRLRLGRARSRSPAPGCRISPAWPRTCSSPTAIPARAWRSRRRPVS